MLWNGEECTGEKVMEKKVSIIVPVYNAEKYLGYAISSVIRQTYENIEIILVNDGSVDKSLQICRNYAEIDSRIKVIDMPNGGVSAARNRGIKEASGEFIQFVDADDVIHKDMTKRLVEIIETYQKDLVICGFQIIELDENLKKAGTELFSSKSLGRGCVLTKDIFFQNMASILWKSCLLEGPCNRLYRSRVIEKYQIQFPLNISLGEDFCFNMDYFKHINGVVFIEESYYYYLKAGKDSLTGCYREDLFENQLFLVQRFEKLLLDYGTIREDEEKQLSEYMIAKMIQSIENFFRKECMLEPIEKRRRIEAILNNEYIRKAFERAGYIYPEYEWIRNKMKFSDVIGTYEWMEKKIENETNQEKEYKEEIQVRRGVLNQLLVGCCNVVLKYFQVIWLEVVRDSLYVYGIKRTLKKVREYVLIFSDR